MAHDMADGNIGLQDKNYLDLAAHVFLLFIGSKDSLVLLQWIIIKHDIISLSKHTIKDFYP